MLDSSFAPSLNWYCTTTTKSRKRQQQHQSNSMRWAVCGAHILRPRPHVSGYFWRRIFFIRIKNICVHTRSVFKNIPVHTKTLLLSNPSVRTLTKKQTIKMPLRDPQRSVRMIWYVVNQCCDVSVFEKLRFHPSTRQHENGVFKKIHSWERFLFEKLRFWDRKHRLRVDTNPKRIKKMSFKKYPDTCRRGSRWSKAKAMLSTTV